MTKSQMCWIAVALFAAAFIATFITITPASHGVNVPTLSLKWFVYVAAMGLVVLVVLPFVPVYLGSLLITSVLRKQRPAELSFKVAAGVTVAWIVLGSYVQIARAS